MNRYQLSQSLNHLPDDLLEQTQPARSRRRLRWKPLAAAAACLLLAAGAWALAGRPAEPTPDLDLPVLTGPPELADRSAAYHEAGDE